MTAQLFLRPVSANRLLFIYFNVTHSLQMRIYDSRKTRGGQLELRSLLVRDPSVHRQIHLL